jgi:hypothetical protein
MIYSTERDQYWPFWCRDDPEVAEATEVNKAGEVFKASKITAGDFRVIQDLEFNNLSANTVFPLPGKLFKGGNYSRKYGIPIF